LPAQPHALERATGPSDKLADHVRAMVARRLPEFATGEVQVATAPGRSGPCPKTAGLATRTFVVTMCKALPTCDGACYRHLVRVTVDASGRIHKLTVTR
jgi:hypothetical protein